MRHLFKSVISGLSIILFLWFACACDELPNFSTFCTDGDKSYYTYECKPILPPISKTPSYQITVRDRVTGEPLSGISYTEFYFRNEISYVECPDACYASSIQGFIKNEEYYFGSESNESGLITNYTGGIMEYKDKGERLMIKVLLKDNQDVYAPKSIYLRFFYNTDPIVKDVFLIKKDEL